MSALHEMVTKSKRATRQDNGQDRLPALWRGIVHEAGTAGVWCLIPHLTGTDPVGPLPSVVSGLVPGDRVVLGAIEGRADDLLVLALI